jgi:hypothetical protein
MTDKDLSIRIAEQEQRLTSAEQHYDAEFARINKSLHGLSEKLDTTSRVLLDRLDQQANNNRITLPLVLSVIGTLLSAAVIAGVIHSQSLRPLYTQDNAIDYRVKKIEEILQNEVNSGHNPHALSLRIDYIEKLNGTN